MKSYSDFKAITSNHAYDRLKERGLSANKVGWTDDLKKLFTNSIVIDNLIQSFDKSLNGEKPDKRGHEFFIHKEQNGTTLAAIGVYKEGRAGEGYIILIVTFLPFREGKKLQQYSYRNAVWTVKIDEYSNSVTINPVKVNDPKNPKMLNFQPGSHGSGGVRKNYKTFSGR